jgi:hypothetical protein
VANPSQVPNGQVSAASIPLQAKTKACISKSGVSFGRSKRVPPGGD